MLDLAWDFFLSVSIRAVFTIFLVGGTCGLVEVYNEWQAGEFKDQPLVGQLALALAGISMLGGAVGTFRKGKAESNFSLIAIASIVAGTGYAHGAVPVVHAGARTLRRFPSLESFVLGGLLIALWTVFPEFIKELCILRIGAIIGGVQILWGLLIERFGAASVAGIAANKQEPSKDPSEMR